jgi:YesN/AraC family two-component response regulator
MTDVGMPVMNGYELIHELKKLAPHLPIIISSGFGDADVTATIAGKDIAGLVSKPYKFEQLREMLQGVIGSTR